MKHWKVYLISILVALAVGGLGTWFTSGGLETYQEVIKPALTPPSSVFPIVWNILYILMGVSFARVLLQGAGNQKTAIIIYGAQLLANFIWSILFFGMDLYCIAFLWLIVLWILILAMVVSFYRVDPLAGVLQVPYLLWVGFAGYLNLMICLLN